MSELDEVLINLFKKQSSDISTKDRIPMTEDLKIKKVAFDMYKVFGDQYNDLWKVEDVDGSSFWLEALIQSINRKREETGLLLATTIITM